MTSPEELGTVEFAAEVQEDSGFGCSTAPTRFPNQIGATSTECLSPKSIGTAGQPNKKGMVRAVYQFLIYEDKHLWTDESGNIDSDIFLTF